MTTDGKGGGSLVENLFALLLSGKLSEPVGTLPTPQTSGDPKAESLRAELRRSLNGGTAA